MSKLLAAAAAAMNGQTSETDAGLQRYGQKLERIVWCKIRTNGGTQMRSGLNEVTVSEYAEAMTLANDYIPFPPLIVFYDGQDYWLGDGFHRHAAAGKAFNEDCSIPCDIRSGTRRDAVLYAAGANADHGLRRTNADKQRAIKTLLDDTEWSSWSNREIARRCKVDEKTVRMMRDAMGAKTVQMPVVSAELPQIQQSSPAGQSLSVPQSASAEVPQMRKFERGGKMHEMKVPQVKYVHLMGLRSLLFDWVARDGTEEARYIRLHKARFVDACGEELRSYLREKNVNWREAELKMALSNFMDEKMANLLAHDRRMAGCRLQYEAYTALWRGGVKRGDGMVWLPGVPTVAEALQSIDECMARQSEDDIKILPSLHYPERMIRVCKSFLDNDVRVLEKLTGRADLADAVRDSVAELMRALEPAQTDVPVL